MFRKRLKGFSLQEILIGIAISVALIGIGATAATTQQKKSRVQTTTSDLSLLASDLQSAFVDVGFPELDPAVPENLSQFKSYLQSLESKYVGCQFQLGDPPDPTNPEGYLTATSNGFTVTALSPVDASKQPYHFRFVTQGPTAGSVMIISYGPNQLDDSNTDGRVEYMVGTTPSFGDDIIAVVTSNRE